MSVFIDWCNICQARASVGTLEGIDTRTDAVLTFKVCDRCLERIPHDVEFDIEALMNEVQLSHASQAV